MISMRRALCSVLVLLATAGSSAAEVVIHSELSPNPDRADCTVSMTGDQGTRLSVILFDEQPGWTLRFSVQGNVEAVSKFFDKDGLQDMNRLRQHVSIVKVGSRDFQLSHVLLFDVMLSELDADTLTLLVLAPHEKVEDVLRASTDDGISFADYADFSGTATALEGFRDCALAAISG